MTRTDGRRSGGDRFRRQKLLSWLDDEGQARVRAASVLVARVGGLGGPFVQSLAAAGVGRIVFYHDGRLLEEDLHRMILMDPDRVGEPRAAQAVRAIERHGAAIDVIGHDARITSEDAARWMAEVDLAVGAAPTYEERLTLNDAALAAGKPFIDAAMFADEAHLLCVDPGRTACLRCVVPEPPPWRDDFPVLGAVSAAIGNLAAVAAVRVLAGRGAVPWGRYLHVDFEQFQVTGVPVAKREGCPACASVPAKGGSR